MAESSAAEHVDPRTERTRRAVLQAAVALLTEEGVVAVTHQRVAERAGVGRATIYRHWPSAVELLYDAVSAADEPLFHFGSEPLVPWLRRELRRAAVEVGQPTAVQFLAFIASRTAIDPAAAQLQRQLVERVEAPIAEAVRNAVLRGELTTAPDAGDLLTRLLGPVVFRVVHEGRPASDEFIDRLVDDTLAPWLRR